MSAKSVPHLQGAILIPSDRNEPLKDAIIRQLTRGCVLSADQKEELWTEFILSQSKYLLIVRDLHSAGEKLRRDIQSALNDEILENCVIAVVCSSFDISRISKHVDATVLYDELLTLEGAQTRIRNILQHRDSDATSQETLLALMTSDPMIGDISRFPIFNSMLCFLDDEQLKLDPCRLIATELIEKVVVETGSQEKLATLESLAYKSYQQIGAFKAQIMKLNLPFESEILQNELHLVDCFRSELLRRMLAASFVSKCTYKKFKSIMKDVKKCPDLRDVLKVAFRLETTKLDEKIVSLFGFCMNEARNDDFGYALVKPDFNIEMCASIIQRYKDDNPEKENYIDGLVASNLPGKLLLDLTNQRGCLIQPPIGFLIKSLRHRASACASLMIKMPNGFPNEKLTECNDILSGRGAPGSVLLSFLKCPDDNVNALRNIETQKIGIISHHQWSFESRGNAPDIFQVINSLLLMTNEVRDIYVANFGRTPVLDREIIQSLDDTISRRGRVTRLYLAVQDRASMQFLDDCKLQNIEGFIADDEAQFRKTFEATSGGNKFLCSWK